MDSTEKSNANLEASRRIWALEEKRYLPWKILEITSWQRKNKLTMLIFHNQNFFGIGKISRNQIRMMKFLEYRYLQKNVECAPWQNPRRRVGIG